MSKQVDERVVSMQFDNKHFERNVSTTMSTLDKLKQKLNFSGASKGLENVSTAAKNVNMSGLGNAVETVRTKFSALEVMGVTALANITNSAVNAGKQLIKSLSIDQLSAGWNKYEQKTASVQSLVNSTGKSVDEINEYLNKLMWYSDETSYGFTDMTSALATMVSSGGDINKLIPMIEGVANATAFAGKGAGEFSRIMQYAINQAYSLGYMQVQDWKSIEGATINSKQLIEQLIKAGEELGKIEKGTVTIENFRNTLKDKWLDKEVMEKGFGAFSKVTEEIYKGIQDGTFENYADGLAKIGNKYGELAQRAAASSQEAKSFTEAIDATKDAVSSGWMKTFEIIFGNYEQAKQLWTDVANTLWDLFASRSESRNNLLEMALGSPSSNAWEKFSDKIKEAGISIEDFQAKLKETASEHGVSLDDLISEYGSLQKAIGSGKISTEMIIETIKKFSKVTEGSTEALKEEDKYIVKKGDNLTKIARKYGTTWREIYELNKDQIKDPHWIFPDQIFKLPDAQLKSIGYTEEQIKAIRELGEQAEKTGTPINELVEALVEMEKPSGRDLLIDTFKNLKDTVMGVASAIKEAWQNIFPPKTIEERSAKLYGLIEGLNEFSKKLKVDDDVAKKLKRTFKGLFAILDIIKTVVGGPLSIAFKLISQLLSAFDLNILDVTAVIGDAIVKFRDWIKSTLDFTEIFKTIVPHVKNAIKVIKEWISAIKDSDFYKAGKNILQGLINGLKNGAQNVWDFIVNIAEQLIEKFKNVLGIHSPSKVFFAIGGFIISGLLLGITNAFPKVGETIKEKFNGIIEFLKGIDWGSIFTGGVILGTLWVGNKMSNALNAFSAPFEGLSEIFSGVGKVLNKSAKGIGKILKNTAKVVKSFSKVMNSISFSIKAKAVKDLATSLLILVGAIIVLTFIDPKKLWISVGVVAALAAILVALSFATEKMSKTSAIIDKNGAKINGFKNGLMTIAASLLIVALAVKMIGSLNQQQAIQGFVGLIAIAGAMVGLMEATKLISGSKNVDKIGPTLIKLSAALLIMVLVAKLAGSMSKDQLIQGTLAIVAFSGIIVGLMAATKLISGSKNVDGIGKTIFKIAGAILIMIIVAKLAASMSVEDLTKGTLAIIAFSGIIVGLMAATKLISGSKNVDKIGKTILMVSVAIGILAGIAVLLSFIETENLVKGITAVGILGIIVAGLMFVTKYAKNCTGNLVAMSVAIGIMALSIAALSFIDPNKLAGATIAIGSLMGIFALMIKASKNATKAMGGIIAMTVAIAVMAGIIYLLSDLPIESTLSSVISLSVLMIAMSGCLLILSKIGKSVKNALMGALGLALLAVPMLAFVGILVLMQGIQNALPNAMTLVALMTAMTLLLIPLTIIGAFGTAGLPYLGVLALLTMAVPMLAFVGILALMQNIQGAVKNSMILILLMNALTNVLVKVSLVAPLALVAVTVVTALIGVITMFGLLVTAVGALMTQFPQLESFVNKGIPIMVKLANGIGEMIGAFIGGIAEQIASRLPQIGASLSQFMINATPFIIGAKMIDDSVAKGAGILVGAILGLTIADFIKGIADFMSFGSSFSALGLELSNFMINAMPFIMGAAMISPEMMNGVKALAETILILTAADVLNGISSWLGGGSSLSDFASEIGLLGTGLRSFSDNLGTFDEAELKKVNSAANAIKTLAEVSATIPNTGGLLGDIVGNNDLGPFAEQFPILGTGLANFLSNIGTFTDEQLATITCASNAVKTLAEASSQIPNTGGRLGEIIGNNDLGPFAEQFPKLGTGLKGFLDNVGTFTDDQVATINCGARAVKTLAEVASSIPNEGGLLSKIVGDNNLGTFASNFPLVGEGLKGFADKLGTFGPEQLSTINTGIRAVKAITELAKIDLSNFTSKIGDFGTKLISFGEKLSTFCGNLSTLESETITTAISNVNKIADMINNLSALDTSAAEKFKNALKDLGESGVDKFISAFTSKSVLSDVKGAATKMIDNFIEGVESKSSDISNSFEDMAEDAAGDIKTNTNYNKFKSAGSYLVDGFAEGISANTFKAEAKAEAMAEAALQAAKEALDINSPSKVFRKLGTSVPEGFAMGIDKLGYMVKDSSVSMARTAIDGTKNAISSIANAINNDIDSQPTIRPVLDLTDVRNGASTIGSMLNGELLSVDTSSVGAISSMMNRRQNGSNDDVISAIKDLGKTIGNGSGNTYTINGITYDDGSAVSDAIQTLVRATRIERRT
jgi:nucleoid-associated protein YgaU